MKKLSGMVDASGDFEHAKELARFFASNINRRVELECKRWVAKRSNQQNKAVMGLWMGIILKELGYESYEHDAVYYAIKEKCWFKEKICEDTGLTFRSAKKTSTLDKAEYSEFMRVFRAYVLDFFGIHLPDPVKSLELI